MKKSDQDRYLLSAQEEHALLLASAQDALKKLATIHVGLEPLPQEDLKGFLNSKKVVDGIVSFTTKEDLQKQWKGVDWKENPLALAHFLASCGKKEIIQEAPLDWKSLASPLPQGRFHEMKEIEPHWLVETMVKGRNVFFEHLSSNYKSSMANISSQKTFWDALLEKGHVTHDTMFDSMRYKNPEKISLFQMAVVYNNKSLYKRFPLTQTITNQDNAEKTMLCALQRNIYFCHDADEKYITRLLNRCIKFKPDLNKVFEKNSYIEQMKKLAEKNASQKKQSKKSANDIHDTAYLYYSHDPKQWQEEKDVSLREELFFYLTQANTTSHAPLVQYFLDDLKSLPENEQQQFIEKMGQACEGFPFGNTSFVSQVLLCLPPALQKSLFKDQIRLLSFLEGVEMLKAYIKADITFDRDVLEICAKVHLAGEDNEENHNSWSEESGRLLPQVFDKDNQDMAKSLGVILSSDRYSEKANLSQQLWQKDFDNNTKRPSQASRLM